MVDPPEAWVGKRLRRWASVRDSEALGDLLKWQRDRAYTAAYQILRHADDAEDAVQLAFMKLLTRKIGFGGIEEFKTAVYRAVVQCAIDQSRARRSRARAESAMPSPIHAASQIASSENAEALAIVGEELSRLPELERAAVILCCQEGMSISGAAEALSIPRMTLRDRLSIAVADMRSRLKQRGTALSVLLLLDLLRHQPVFTASAKLSDALDAKIPGASCADIGADRLRGCGTGQLAAELKIAFPMKAIPAAFAATIVVIVIGHSVWTFSGKASLQFGNKPGTPAPTQVQEPLPTVPVAVNEAKEFRPVAPAETTPRKNDEKQEENDVNKLKKVGVLAGAILMGAAARAADNGSNDAALRAARAVVEKAAAENVVTVSEPFKKVDVNLVPKAVNDTLTSDPKNAVKIESAEKAPSAAAGTTIYKLNGNDKQLVAVDAQDKATVIKNVVKVLVDSTGGQMKSPTADVQR